jgi:hypothetical protein
MVLIFGWGAGEAQDLGEVAPTVCPNCHNQVFLHHVRSKKSVRLYFVPVVPYGTDEYLLCPVCRQGLQVSGPQVPAVESMRAMTSSFRRGAIQRDVYRTAVGQFWIRIGVAPSGKQVLRPASSVPPPRPPVVAATEETSLSDQLVSLARLHAQGVLSDEEFAAAKEHLLRH